jgi:hypothetical protein
MVMSQSGRQTPARVAYYGSTEPLPERREVRAGPLTAVLEGADLRYLSVDGEVVILRLYAAIRDRSWGTITPIFTRYNLDQSEQAFTLSFTAEHVSGGEQDVDFAWQGAIVGSEDGTIKCVMDGAARSDFWRNRIGWCVLHPMELAGRPVEIRSDGQWRSREFPSPIAPHQPFLDIEQMRHRTAIGGLVTVAFEGDLFETEDQRNWTDASYKTYSTPLRLPYPVQLRAGDRVRQSVTVTAEPKSRLVATTERSSTLSVRVGTDAQVPLPPIGLATAGHGRPLSERERELFRACRLGHLHHVVDLSASAWEERLRQVSEDAGAIGCPLGLEVLTAEDGHDFAALTTTIPSLPAPVARIAVFPRSAVTITDRVLAAAREARDEVGLNIPIGGGSRAYFTQLNRATPSPELLDFVAYGLNPQVHAFDNASMVETLAAQAVTVESARAITDGRPVVVGPVTLLPRINPDAVPTVGSPAAGSLPVTVDVRQPSLFAAGWTVGSVRHLAAAGVEALTYFETTGWRGLIERSDHDLRVPAFHSRPGMVFPVYHVLRDISELSGAYLLPVEVSDRLAIEALALISGHRFRLLVASLQEETATVELVLPPLSVVTWRSLNETTYDFAADDVEGFRQTGEPLPVFDGMVTVELRPFSVATVDGTLVVD